MVATLTRVVADPIAAANEIDRLRSALAKCLEILHDFYGLTDKEMAAAIEDAATNPEWHPRDDNKWRAVAYPRQMRVVEIDPTADVWCGEAEEVATTVSNGER